jgi:hypothetical protein
VAAHRGCPTDTSPSFPAPAGHAENIFIAMITGLLCCGAQRPQSLPYQSAVRTPGINIPFLIRQQPQLENIFSAMIIDLY